MPTLLVRNMEKGPTVFSDLGENIHLEWQGRGDNEGRDVQRVPDKLMENVDFLRTVDRGILKIERPTPEVEAKLKEQAEAVKAQREASAAAIMDTIDHQAEESIVTTEINEKGDIVTQTHEDDDESQVSDDGPADGPAVPQEESPQASTVQMDEEGNIIDDVPEPQVIIESRQKG